MVERLARAVAVAAFVASICPARHSAAQESPTAGTSLVVDAFSPFSPFSRVTWEIKRVGATPAVALTLVHAGDYGVDSELVLVSEGRWDEILRATEVCRRVEAIAAVSRDPAPADAGDTVRVRARVVLDGAVDEWEVHDLDATPEAVACLEAVREAVISEVDPGPYDVPFWDPGEFGTLRATSSRPAAVWVDGRPTGLVTPLDGLRLEPGIHVVRWVALVGGQQETRDVRITDGMTTVVNVDL